MLKKQLLIIGFILLSISQITAQVVYERYDNEVHSFLGTMSQKGIIEWNDLIFPISKQKIYQTLLILDKERALLNTVEVKELIFYLQEYREENSRKKLVSKYDSTFSINIDPIITASIYSGTSKNYKSTSVGISLWGNISKKVGYQFAFQDINLNGTGIDSVNASLSAGSQRGYVQINDPNKKKQVNYTDIRASLSYSFKNGSISIGQDALTWGYGENGKMILSNKAPNYPYIRLDYSALKWLTFNYTHAFLQSGIIDSARSYPIPSRIFPAIREVDIQKFMASHSIDIRLKKGLHVSVGESVIYNDHLQLGYLLPIMFFKAYDNFINRGVIQSGSNGQFFGQISAQNLMFPKSHFYTTLFIDEIRVASIFDKQKARNQIGFNVGFVKQDFLQPNLIVGLEYTKIRPYVYRNFLPAQDYTSNGFLLGDWAGANSDRLVGFLKYTPLAKLKLYLRYQLIRKGPAGSIFDQYFQQPQVGFMETVNLTQKELVFKASYEYKNRLLVNFSYTNNSAIPSYVNVGVSYGL